MNGAGFVYRLKPCPFCGREVKVYENDDDFPVPVFSIRCGTKGCMMQFGANLYEDKVEAVNKWNGRCGQ